MVFSWTLLYNVGKSKVAPPMPTTYATGFEEMSTAHEAVKDDSETAAKLILEITKDEKSSILINVEEGVNKLVSAIKAKNEKVEGLDINGEKFAALPNFQTGVVMYFLTKGLKKFDIGFSQPPTSLAIRGTMGAYNKRLKVRRDC